MSILIIKSRSGFRFGKRIGDGQWEFDTDQLSENNQATLTHWMRVFPETVVSRREPTPTPAPAPEPLPEQFSMDDVETEVRREVQAAAHFAEAEARLAQYEAEGLVPNEHNKTLIKDFVNNSVAKGFWSREVVEVAVETLRKRLQWAAPKPVAPMPVPTDEEVLGIIPNTNGQRQLSIKRPIPQSASAAQAKDWLARFREANGLKFSAFGR